MVKGAVLATISGLEIEGGAATAAGSDLTGCRTLFLATDMETTLKNDSGQRERGLSANERIPPGRDSREGAKIAE